MLNVGDKNVIASPKYAFKRKVYRVGGVQSEDGIFVRATEKLRKPAPAFVDLLGRP
jgi:hypothetical protein